MITCQVLGPVQVTVDGGPAPPELLWRKHLALLVYLARSPRRTRTREHLMGLLWADKAESAARHSLNEALRVLRRAGGDATVESRVDQVILDEDMVRMDVEEFEHAVEAGDLERAGQLAVGEFLEGFSVQGASEFEDWLSAERRHWAGRMATTLVRRSEALTAAGRLADAVSAADRALAIEPESEPAVRALARGLALAGERGAAVERATAFMASLRERTGAEPSPALRTLVDRIRASPQLAPPAGVSPEASCTRRLPLLGRAAELERLTTAWVAARTEPHPALLFVAGDPGTGRSRLLEELAQRARLDGATAVAVRCVSLDQSSAWSGTHALARGLVDAPGVAGAPPAAVGHFATSLPVWRERFPDAGDSGQSPGAAFTDVLRVVAEEQPVLLVVDDAHDLDTETLELLQALPRDLAGCPVVIAVATRVHHDRDGLDQLLASTGRDVPGAAVRLAPLDGSALRELVRATFPAYTPPQVERLARRLAMDSAGLPLLAVELLHAVAHGLELEGGGAWPEPLQTLDQSLPGDLPDAVIGAIRVGFRRLSAEAQRVLAAASVLDERCSAEELAGALELNLDAVHRALDELEWTRWLVSEPRGYSFLARVVRDVVARDMLTPGARQRILERR